jgi:transposase
MSLIESITVENLDHLGIVAGLIDEIGIVELINQKLGVDNREKITTGQVIKALILNGLGMVSRPLYLFSQFFEDKAIEKLNRTAINSEYLNDDKIGLLMDDIYKLGLTNLFIEIGLLVIKKFKIDTSYAHLDSTSFHLHGEYNNVVHFLRINQSPKVVNLTEERSLILEFLPSSCQKYYLGNNNKKR